MLFGDGAFHALAKSIRDQPCCFANVEVHFFDPLTQGPIVTCYFGNRDYAVHKPLIYGTVLETGCVCYGEWFNNINNACLHFVKDGLTLAQVEKELQNLDLCEMRALYLFLQPVFSEYKQYDKKTHHIRDYLESHSKGDIQE